MDDLDKVCFQNVVEPNRFEPEYTNDLQQFEEERANKGETERERLNLLKPKQKNPG